MTTNESFESTKPDELKEFLGKHFIYTYDNGWQYELYIKNAFTIDYRIHSGIGTICFQNEHISEMLSFRDKGPTYPKLVIDEFATITFIEDCGLNNEEVIQCAADRLPSGYASRNN